MNLKFNNRVRTAIVLGLAAAGTVTGTTEAVFSSVLDEVKGWLVGPPGKIIVVLAFGAAMLKVIKQNYIAAVGAFLGSMLMAHACNVIDTIFSAGI